MVTKEWRQDVSEWLQGIIINHYISDWRLDIPESLYNSIGHLVRQVWGTEDWEGWNPNDVRAQSLRLLEVLNEVGNKNV